MAAALDPCSECVLECLHRSHHRLDSRGTVRHWVFGRVKRVDTVDEAALEFVADEVHELIGRTAHGLRVVHRGTMHLRALEDDLASDVQVDARDGHVRTEALGVMPG